jgi:hypothetical protein
MFSGKVSSLGGRRSRRLTPLTLLWVLLAAFAPVAVPILHSIGDAHHTPIAPSNSDELGYGWRAADAGGGLHGRGCPHGSPTPSHDGSRCLTCRTLQHSRYSVLSPSAAIGDAFQVQAFPGEGDLVSPARANLSESAPRAPPHFS